MTLFLEYFHIYFESNLFFKLLIMKIFFFNSPVFMGILTLILTALLAWFIYNISVSIHSNNKQAGFNRMKHVLSIGFLALIIGELHQLIVWYKIIHNIELANDITANIAIKALKTSTIPLIYGLFIFFISIILWGVSKFLLQPKIKI